jgi:hypothetical protein
MSTATNGRATGVLSMRCIGAQTSTMKLAHTLARLRASTIVLLGAAFPSAATQAVDDAIDREAKAIEGQVIAWRRAVLQNPELGNREIHTLSLVRAHLSKPG